MKLTLVALALCAVAAVNAETFMKETFDGRLEHAVDQLQGEAWIQFVLRHQGLGDSTSLATLIALACCVPACSIMG